MMRLNAPKPAFLALAALLLSSACGFAKPTRYAARKASAVALRRAVASNRSARLRHSVHRRNAAEQVKQGSGARVYGHASTARRVRDESTRGRCALRHGAGRSHGRMTERELTVSEARWRRNASPLAIHGTYRPDEPGPARVSARGRRNRFAPRPVAVVSVIRPTASRPELASVEEAASTPVILPTLYNKRGRLIVPPALRGSHEILVHQNEVADRDGLRRIQNDDDLAAMRKPRRAGRVADECGHGGR